MRNRRREKAATDAAFFLKRALGIMEPMDTAIVLGTGWGDTLELERERAVKLDAIPGFGRVQELSGHARRVVCGELNGHEVLLLRGRVHLNEAPCTPNIYKQVRLQIEMLFHLGVTNLVLTCAAGSLLDQTVKVGDLVIITDFISLFAPPMPLWAGEFCSPKDALSADLEKLAKSAGENFPSRLHFGNYVMIRGPNFDSLPDKKIMAAAGAMVVGMSTYPEVCVASLYSKVRVLAVAFVTNSMIECHNHESNLATAKDNASYLGNFLVDLFTRLSYNMEREKKEGTMADSCSIPPFKPAFGALHPALIKKPKDKDEFIVFAQAVLDGCPTTPPERQALRGAITAVKSGKLNLGDWPCIAIFLEIAKIAQNLDPNDLY